MQERPREPDEGPHHARDRPPPGHRAQRRPHRGAGRAARCARRARHDELLRRPAGSTAASTSCSSRPRTRPYDPLDDGLRGRRRVESEALTRAVTVRSLNHRFLDLTRPPAAPPAGAGGGDQARWCRSASAAARRAAVQAAFAATRKARRWWPAAARRRARARAARDQSEHALAGGVAVADVGALPGRAGGAWTAPGRWTTSGAPRLLALARRGRWTGSRRCARPRARACSATSRRASAAIDGGAARASRRADGGAGKAARATRCSRRCASSCAELGLDDARLYQEVVRAGGPPRRGGGAPAAAQPRAQAREAAGGDGPAGKRLDFLAQELAREANTIGSKAASRGGGPRGGGAQDRDRAAPRAGAER